MAASTTGIDVILDNDMSKSPHCLHGPTLLFEKYFHCKGACQYYGCAAFRDRKLCNFYQPANVQLTKNVQEARMERYKDQGPQSSHIEYYKRFQTFAKYPVPGRTFCRSCSTLVLEEDTRSHKGHDQLHSVTDEMLESTPSYLLSPIEENKSFAQYMFSKDTVTFVVEMLVSLGYSHILCIGAPRIHEAVRHEKMKNGTKVKSLLLDLDHRFEQFYSPSEFCRYNMFNYHFFDGERSEDVFTSFLAEQPGKLAVVMDPPYGGRVEVLAHTLKHINTIWLQKVDNKSSEMATFWFFPYFNEPRIVECLPSLCMLDYKVNYDNHDDFTCGPKGRKHGSPVRIFTNVLPCKVVLPAEQNYRYCEECRKYVAEKNTHCDICKACTSKDGSTYRHCERCNRCVKPNHVHCDTCDKCLNPSHVCGHVTTTGCHICGDITHKRRDCPNKTDLPKSNNKRRHEDNRSMQQKKVKKSVGGEENTTNIHLLKNHSRKHIKSKKKKVPTATLR